MEKGDGSVVIVVDADSRDAEKKLKEVAKKAQNLQNDLQKGKDIVFRMDVSEAEKEMHRLQTNISRLQERAQGKGLLLSGTKAEYSQLESKFNEAKLSKNAALAESIAKDLDALDKKAQSYEAAISETNTKIEAQKTLLAQVSKAIVEQAQQAEAAAEAAKARRDTEIDAMVDRAIAREKEKAEENAAARAAWEAERATQQTAKYSQETAEAYKNFQQVSKQIQKSEEQERAAQEKAAQEQEKARAKQEALDSVRRVAAAEEETARFQREIEQEAQKYINELNRAEVPLSKLEKSYEAQKIKIQETVQKIQELKAKKEEAQQTALFSQRELDNEKRKLAEMQAAYAGTKNADEKIMLAEQKERVRQMANEYNRLNNSAESYKSKIADAEKKLRRQVDAAKQLSEAIEAANNPAKKAKRLLDKINKQMEKLVKRVAGLAQRVFIFSMITAAFRSIRSWLGNIVKTNSDAVAQIQKFKAAVLVMAQPLVDVIVPAFEKILEVLTTVASYGAAITSSLFGTTVEDSKKAAENLYDESQALDETGDSAKKAEKSLASFDEINQLSGSNDAQDSKKDEAEANKPDFKGVLEKKLDELAALISGALLVLGAILFFSGANVPLGLGLMVVGAAGLAAAIKENWNSIITALQGPIGLLTAILSAALLLIGAILVFSGANIPLGLALMVIGAMGLAAVIAANWDKIKELLQGPIGIAIAIISVALLVLGAIILFSGANIPLGIGLMVAGAIGLATVIAANWDTVKEKLQGPLGVLVGILSTALLVLGAIFTFTGANIPFGIAMMLVGAAGLATVAVVNWDTITGFLQGTIGKIVAVVSAALLVLGAILVFSGAGIALGIGMIVVGAIGLAASIAANWNAIVDKLNGPLNTILTMVSGALLVLGVILLFTGAAATLGLGLIIAGVAGLASEAVINDDWVKTLGLDKVSGWVSTAMILAGIAMIAIGAATANLPLLLAGVALAGGGAAIKGLSANSGSSVKSDVKNSALRTNAMPELSMRQIPHLASGAVIPANQEFLAVLGDQKQGTNIETPLSTMVQAFKQALSDGGFSSSGNGSQTVVLRIGEQEMGRVVYKLNQQQTQRVGVKLAGG